MIIEMMRWEAHILFTFPVVLLPGDVATIEKGRTYQKPTTHLEGHEWPDKNSG
jgi:hypothetical protein